MKLCFHYEIYYYYSDLASGGIGAEWFEFRKHSQPKRRLRRAELLLINGSCFMRHLLDLSHNAASMEHRSPRIDLSVAGFQHWVPWAGPN